MDLYKREDGHVTIHLPMINKGKFRWKNRPNVDAYGQGFATKSVPYSDQSYVEWQIGYDVPLSKLGKTKKTKLANITFRGDNGKAKCPYELSEILYEMLLAKIITIDELSRLINDIEKTVTSLDKQYHIEARPSEGRIYDGLPLQGQEIALPKFIYRSTAAGPIIEISIEKQQHATGIQPMLYISIPLILLENKDAFIGKTNGDQTPETGDFIIDQRNKDCFLNVFRLFAICSRRHKNDVHSILCAIRDYFQKQKSHQ